MVQDSTVTPDPIAPDTSGYEDYWGTDETVKHYLPDGKQYFVIKPMNEGEKAKFQKLTSRSVTLKQGSGDAAIDVDPAGERWALINASVKDWSLVKKDEKSETGFTPIAFQPKMLNQWLEVAPPKIVEDLEHAIRMANPWMQNEMTTEEIDKELERLYDLRKQVVERESGEGASATK